MNDFDLDVRVAVLDAASPGQESVDNPCIPRSEGRECTMDCGSADPACPAPDTSDCTENCPSQDCPTQQDCPAVTAGGCEIQTQAC